MGWPLALRLSNKGHQVHIVDNLSRRSIDTELKSGSITDIRSIKERIQTWTEVSGHTIGFTKLDVSTDFDELVQLFKELKPKTVIHLGEQRSAPYSMKNNKTRQYTARNNLMGTHSILNAILETDRSIHLVHMGTMGVYGYGVVPDTVVPEGYIEVDIKNQKGDKLPVEILHPTYPGSVYHLTKTQDALFFQYYAKNYKLRITDLHQGIIWGAETSETKKHPNLVNRFDYDSDYGTVLNRFMMQVAYGMPLTIYGTGQQTRAFIHIENSMDCVELAIQNPPTQGDRVKIFNQVTETHSLQSLAELIQATFPNVEKTTIQNPRNELQANQLRVQNKQFLDLGLHPIFVTKEELKTLYDFITSHKSAINEQNVLPLSFWN